MLLLAVIMYFGDAVKIWAETKGDSPKGLSPLEKEAPLPAPRKPEVP